MYSLRNLGESKGSWKYKMQYIRVKNISKHTILRLLIPATHPGRIPGELQANLGQHVSPQSSSSKHDGPEHPNLPCPILSYYSQPIPTRTFLASFLEMHLSSKLYMHFQIILSTWPNQTYHLQTHFITSRKMLNQLSYQPQWINNWIETRPKYFDQCSLSSHFYPFFWCLCQYLLEECKFHMYVCGRLKVFVLGQSSTNL